MNPVIKEQMVTRHGPLAENAGQGLKELGIDLPAPREPFGIYAEAVQTGNRAAAFGIARQSDAGRPAGCIGGN
jgi:hypothetical protein